MFQNLWPVIYPGVLLVILIPLPSLSATVCDASTYGNPKPLDCSRILLDDPTEGSHGLESTDPFSKSHLFYGRALDQRPPDVSISEWTSGVQLAGVVFSRERCNVFLAIRNGTDNFPIYDTGTFSSIANQVTKVQDSCSQFSAPEEPASSMKGGQGWIGTRGHILIVFYTNSSTFASRLAKSKVNEISGNFMELLEAQDPPTNPEPKPKCKRYPYCSNSGQCRGALGCICVADKWHGDFWSTACKYPFPDLGRGLFEIGSVNATQASPFVNRTLAATSLGDTACPCNCTYVSKACCDSPAGIVYEGIDLKLGSVQPPSVNVTCNPTTGDFQTSNTTPDVLLPRP